MRKSTPKSPPKQVASMQIVFGSILAISLLLAINFSGRIAAGQRIQAELTVLQATIDTERMKATALQQEFEYVNSDAFVEEWARSPEGMMIKEGEILVIPVPGQTQLRPTATPFVPTADSSTENDNQNWTLWWQMFFDSPPPGSNN
jgi:cell division protein FtsB